jgi:hypothetical protein
MAAALASPRSFQLDPADYEEIEQLHSSSTGVCV